MKYHKAFWQSQLHIHASKQECNHVYNEKQRHRPSNWFIHEIQCLTGKILNEMKSSAEANKRKKGAICKAKCNFFDRQLTHLHKTHIWDVVSWTQPHWQIVNVSHKDQQSNPVLELDKTAKVLHKQFTPLERRPIDNSVIDDIPDMPQQHMLVIFNMLLVKALAETSNFSAPDPDHVD